MPSDAEILALVQAAFAHCERLEHFIDFTHCEECAQHDELLRSRDNDTLRIEDVGNPGWNPLCYVSPEGFAYFFPGLARLTLSEPSKPDGWFGSQLLFHLTYQYERNRHLRAFAPQQRRAVATLLLHVAETRQELARSYICQKDLDLALRLWSEPANEMR